MSQNDTDNEDRVEELSVRAASAAAALKLAGERRGRQLGDLTDQVRTLTIRNGDLNDRVEDLERTLLDERESRESEAQIYAARLANLEGDLARVEADLARETAMKESLNEQLLEARTTHANLEAELTTVRQRLVRMSTEFDAFLASAEEVAIDVEPADAAAERDDVLAASRTRFSAQPSLIKIPGDIGSTPPAISALRVVGGQDQLPIDISAAIGLSYDRPAAPAPVAVEQEEADELESVRAGFQGMFAERSAG